MTSRLGMGVRAQTATMRPGQPGTPPAPSERPGCLPHSPPDFCQKPYGVLFVLSFASSQFLHT